MATETVSPKGIETVIKLFGNFDENVRIIEDGLNVKLISRDDEIKLSGNKENIEKASVVIERLISIAAQGEVINKQNVSYLVELASEGNLDKVKEYPGDCICITARGKQVKSKTHGQKKYVDAIKKNTVVFGIGPAGTGKTFLAVAMAVTSFKDKHTDTPCRGSRGEARIPSGRYAEQGRSIPQAAI